jgi:hypothetical protein
MYGSNMQKTFSNVGVHTFKVPSRSSSQSNSGNSGGSGGNGSSNNSGNTGSNQSSSNSGGSGSNQSAIGKEDDFGVERDDAWLEAHNVRRKKYHVQWGKSYVPLKWSPMLANEARQWANQLLDGCGSPFSTANHEPGVSEGENMARNIGSGDNGELKTPDQILNRWVEMEFNDGYPENAHLTQVCYADFIFRILSSVTHIIPFVGVVEGFEVCWLRRFCQGYWWGVLQVPGVPLRNGGQL